MLLVAAFLLSVVSVPLAGGRVAALADFRVERAWLLCVALAIQVAILSLFDEGSAEWLAAAHVASYAIVIVFLASNRSVPGLWLVSIGTALNATAIVANGGVMPASRSALEAAGRPGASDGFANSRVVADANLAFLGDVFAWPQPLPLANVFSVGDVCIVVGAAMILHQACGSRLAPRSIPSRRPARRRQRGRALDG